MQLDAEILPPLDGPPPMEHAVFIDDAHRAWVPHPFLPDARRALPLRSGLAMGWTPFPEARGALVALWAGNQDSPSEQAIAVALSREGLKAFIADLQSVDRQLEDML